MLFHCKRNLLNKILHPDGGSFRLNYIPKHECNMSATSSTLLESATHLSDSESDFLEDCASLIPKPKDLRRKCLLNDIFEQKSANYGSNN